MMRHQGFSLVELVVAMTILTISLVGLAGAAAVAHRSFIGAGALEHGIDAAAFVLDSLIREPAPVDGERQLGSATARWTVAADSIATGITLMVRVVDGDRERELSFYATHHAK